MDTARIAVLLQSFLSQPLAPMQLEQISTYINLLLRWNARINLTAIRNEEEIVTRHFGESFFLARHVVPRSVDRQVAKAPAQLEASAAAPQALTRILDIGSGAGFPALPIKIWAPEIHLTMIESSHKKAAFLREVARALTLTNVDVIADRAEALAGRDDVPRANIVTLRAVENFARALAQAEALLMPNGCLALLIGISQAPLLKSAPNVQWKSPIPIPQSNGRVLSIGIIMNKVEQRR
jgi:16S rRNA (guanine527-N7)-methyltransferase